ncbi:helix-turn-helix domain-containing protein [Cellvibrio polysaccharolyticus]|uniref:ImmA/IrrE family metallo-endopeptidase n=1 Tax=Cellvibrio polysaccharolyticus TaxID=2082724 RepID=A0A928YVY0_9GAMM|nr:XRE family transcriptional regulator [Cellvibrio polysaccharolyticus]MBE8717583.1 ImmA/IrrE family metallo-endopeptidase [Cellvibrio polysaccharolyticus]
MKLFNPNRLILARQRRGLTKVVLAERAGLSSKLITLYEKSIQEPTEESLKLLANTLGFPVSFFSGDDIEAPTGDNASFRSFSRMTASQRDAALAAGGIAYLFSDWIDKNFNLPLINVPDCSGMEPEAAAMVVRNEWLLGQAPIKNLVHLLESKGIRVYSLSEETNQVNAFSCWRRGTTPFVFLNTQKSNEASRFDAAHELGHLVLHRHGENKGKQVEAEANAFASALLMPKESIFAYASTCKTTAAVIKTKKFWNVSAMALTYRLHKVGLLSEWVYRDICIELSTKGARTKEIDPSPRENSQILQKVLTFTRDNGKSLQKIASELNLKRSDLVPYLFGLAPVVVESNQLHMPSPPRMGKLQLVKN